MQNDEFSDLPTSKYVDLRSPERTVSLLFAMVPSYPAHLVPFYDQNKEDEWMRTKRKLNFRDIFRKFSNLWYE